MKYPSYELTELLKHEKKKFYVRPMMLNCLKDKVTQNTIRCLLIDPHSVNAVACLPDIYSFVFLCNLSEATLEKPTTLNPNFILFDRRNTSQYKVASYSRSCRYTPQMPCR